MKQYRLHLFNKSSTEWIEWRNINVPFENKDILIIQFNEPLTIEESKEFFKTYVEKV